MSTKPIRPVRSALDLQEQINAGIDLRDWEPEHIVSLMEDHIKLQETLAEADAALALAGVHRGAGNVRDTIKALLNP